MNKQNVAVIGLGSMGLGIACSALRGGHRVWGAEPNPVQMAKFRSDGGELEAPIKVADVLDAVVVVVVNAAQTKDVLFGDTGIVPKMRKGAVVVSCATVPPEFARKMAALCTEHGVHYLDAPISGGVQKSMNGRLTIMASGSADAFDAARPVLCAISETLFELGDQVGAGSAMKSVNQMLAGVHIAVMAEAVTFGMTQGVTPDKFIEVISKCAGTSWMLENRAPHIAAGDYTPHSSVNIWPKDLGIVMDIAGSAGFDAPITMAALNQFNTAVDMGLGREDDAAVAKVYAYQTGLTLPGTE
ncbi:MAG: putative dehydrogenase [Ascidiaceihabitans sp.]|jgi:putative dehydrogenase